MISKTKSIRNMTEISYFENGEGGRLSSPSLDWVNVLSD